MEKQLMFALLDEENRKAEEIVRELGEGAAERQFDQQRDVGSIYQLVRSDGVCEDMERRVLLKNPPLSQLTLMKPIFMDLAAEFLAYPPLSDRLKKL